MKYNKTFTAADESIISLISSKVKNRDIVKVFELIKRYSSFLERVVTRIELDLTITKLNGVFTISCRFGYSQIVKLFLDDKPVYPSAKNNYAIRWASENGHFEVVKLLLADPRVVPSADDNDAIRWASRNGHSKVTQNAFHQSMANNMVSEDLFE